MALTATTTQQRDLNEEFDRLMPLYQGSAQEHVEGFATLFIDTLKAETQKHQWSELSEKFPVAVQLWAMNEMKKEFMKRLKLSAAVTNRWSANIELLRHDAKLLEMTVEGPIKEAQKEIVSRCLTKCSALMFSMLKDKGTKPTSVSDLRQLLDTSHSPSLQLRVFERERSTFMKIFQPLFTTKESFHLFKEGVKLGKLYDDNVRNTTPESKSVYEAHLSTLAAHLRQRLLEFDSLKLSDKILEQYPSMVKYRVLGQEQCVLMKGMKERKESNQRSKLPCIKEIRSIVAGLKEELELDSEALTKSKLLRYLRRLTAVKFKRGRVQSSSSVISKEVGELPTKIVLTAIENASADGDDLDVKLIDLFDTQPPHVFIPVMVRDIKSILDASCEQHHGHIISAHRYVTEELVPLVKMERRQKRIAQKKRLISQPLPDTTMLEA